MSHFSQHFHTIRYQLPTTHIGCALDEITFAVTNDRVTKLYIHNTQYANLPSDQPGTYR